MIIGLTGKAGSGKNAVAEVMRHHHGFREEAFADNLKAAAAVIFDLSIVNFYDQKLKEVFNPYWDMTPREMLQKLGTEACRNTFGGDIWMKSLGSKLGQGRGERVVITDVRFENEAAMIRAKGGVVVHVHSNRESKLADGSQAHASEAGIELNQQDYQLFNHKTLAELPFIVSDTLKMIDGVQ